MRVKNKVKPHEKRRGWLKNNNPPGDFMWAPRCGAKTRKGTLCQAPAMRNGRCRLHGGKSTGPRTAEGIVRIRQAHLIHGMYTKEAIVEKKQLQSLLSQLKKTINEIDDEYDNMKIKT